MSADCSFSDRGLDVLAGPVRHMYVKLVWTLLHLCAGIANQNVIKFFIWMTASLCLCPASQSGCARNVIKMIQSCCLHTTCNIENYRIFKKNDAPETRRDETNSGCLHLFRLRSNLPSPFASHAFWWHRISYELYKNAPPVPVGPLMKDNDG